MRARVRSCFFAGATVFLVSVGSQSSVFATEAPPPPDAHAALASLPADPTIVAVKPPVALEDKSDPISRDLPPPLIAPSPRDHAGPPAPVGGIEKAALTPATVPDRAVAPVKDVAPHSLTRDVAPNSLKGEDRGIDPEPDVAIKPPVVVPPVDPLQVPATKPAEAATPATPEEPLPPINAAIKRALDKREAVEIRGERRRRREAIAFFYAAHAFAPLWSKDGAPIAAVEPVVARLALAEEDALTLVTPPKPLVATPQPDDIAEFDLAMSEAVVAYAREATGSRVDPHSIAPLIGLKPALADATETLEGVVGDGTKGGDRLRAFNPSEPRYIALREKLAELRAAHLPALSKTIPAGPDLRIGMRDPRVPLIRARFSLDGTTADEPNSLRYDTEVAAAVADFQKANGLPASGVLTRRTIAALSGGQPSRLEGQLVANMEMWRWMPRDLGADRIEVNVPAYTVTVFRAGVETASNKVVVGKIDTPTPLFSNAMQYVIVNPVWNVPDSIIKKEMLPRLDRDPGYLDRLGYTVTSRNGKLIVKQPAGAKNALGRVKFIFPNDYAVYLHDTPSKALFASAKRAFSHGCVRVDQPFRFAESVLGPDKGWSEDRLKSLLGDKERYLHLPNPLPIHIEYFTARVDETGHLALLADVYDYIHRIAMTLGRDS